MPTQTTGPVKLCWRCNRFMPIDDKRRLLPHNDLFSGHLCLDETLDDSPFTACFLCINKSPRGWSVESVVKYSDWKNPCSTYSGSPTLASALWDTLSYIMELPDNPRLVAITVKSKPMTPAEAYRIIEKDLRGHVLSYALPAYRKFLLGA